ncbi:UNVERIFIED_CONTAM: Subtilisin-like serine proteases [Acetivibrio alkalicellulosi]
MNIVNFKTDRVSDALKMDTIEVGEDVCLKSLLNYLNNHPDVSYAQHDYLIGTYNFSNMEYYHQQWAIENYGQTVLEQNGIQGIDMNVSELWEITQGSEDVIVAVIDTGVDINHPELSDSIFVNNKESMDGEDSDGNGLIDDISGWNFVDNTNDVYNCSFGDFHGTHITGIIAASWNKNGIIGIAPNVKILPIKVMERNSGKTSDAIKAIEYASSMGASIFNCSWGTGFYNQALKDVISNTEGLFIFPAGNQGKNTDRVPIYPAAYELDNIISVAAIDNRCELSDFSSYGENVDIGAPGVAIISTATDGRYAYMCGSSVAVPHVAGVAALLKSYDNSLTEKEIKERIIKNVTKSQNLKGKVASSGWLNASAALLNEPPIYNEEPVKEEGVVVLSDTIWISSQLIEVVPDKYTASVGDIITVEVKIKDVSFISGYEISLSYDPNVVRPVKKDLTPYESGITKSSIGIKTNRLKGDINGDGLVNSTDYILLRRYILGISGVLDDAKKEFYYVADLNGDGLVNSTDCVLLRRYLLEIISKFPASEEESEGNMIWYRDVITNGKYSPISFFHNDSYNSKLILGATYMSMENYRNDGIVESGDILARIKFEVLKENRIIISSEGIKHYDINGNRIRYRTLDYRTRQINFHFPEYIPEISEMPVIEFPPSMIAGKNDHTFSGYVSPCISELGKNGFKVSVDNTTLTAITDRNGYFEIKNVPQGNLNITISKEGYLNRTLRNVSTVDMVIPDGSFINYKHTIMGTEEYPVEVMAGDINSDNAICMSDLIIIARANNTMQGKTGYNPIADINKDGAINMEDVIIVVRNISRNINGYYGEVLDPMFKFRTDVNGIARSGLSPLDFNEVQYIAIHHALAVNYSAHKCHRDHYLRIENGNEWWGIAYNEYIEKNGRVFIGRGHYRGAHAGTRRNNEISYGICVEGDYHNFNQPLPRKQFDVLVERVYEAMLKFEIQDVDKVVPHKYFGGTYCPGDYFPIEELRNELRKKIYRTSN